MSIVKVDKISNYTEIQLYNMLASLSESRRNRIIDYKGQHYKQSIVASFGLEEKLSMICGYKISDIIYSYSESGKPQINGDYNISISHSKDSVCFGISEDLIGVDIEEVRSLDMERLSNARFFRDEEKEWTQTSPINFLFLWTFKEALCKCLDIPLMEVLSEVVYPVVHQEDWGSIDIKDQLFLLGAGVEGELEVRGKKVFFQQYIKDEAIVAVCETLSD